LLWAANSLPNKSTHSYILGYRQPQSNSSKIKTNTQTALYIFQYTRVKLDKLLFLCAKIQTNIKTTSTLIVRPSLMSIGIKVANVGACTIMAIRKFKVFNKGRYSRTRQLYRTGVYWCLLLNIILVVGLYFWFYRFMFNFGYV
jgi:hypothetical protein